MLSSTIALIADEDVNKGTDPISWRRLIENLDCYDFLNRLKVPNMVDSPLDSGHLRLTRLLNARRIGFRKSLTFGRRLVDVRQVCFTLDRRFNRERLALPEFKSRVQYLGTGGLPRKRDSRGSS